ARLRARSALALATAAGLGIASFLPTPTYVQYFCVVVPFLAVAAVEPLTLVRRRTATLVLVGCLAAYAGAAAFAVRDFTRHERFLRPSIASVQAVAARVDAATSRGEHVLSAWPGY